MPLIKSTDIVTLRKYVRMNFTANAAASMPDLDAAERKFLIPVLTQDVFDVLQVQVDSNTIPWNTLLNLCRAAVAPLAVWLDLPFLQSQIGDDGLKTTRSDNKEATHQWEYVKVEAALVNKGMAALEDLIIHLLKSGADYKWDNADTKESFIKTGFEFSKFAYLHQPNLTFQQLKPLMIEVEDHFFRSAIGDNFFEALRDNENTKEEEKKAVLLIKKAIAQFTVVRAVERMPVKITPNGLMASLQNNSDAFNSEKPAEGSALDRLMKSAQREGDAYQAKLIAHLNANASGNLFPLFFNSEFYKAPAKQGCDPNNSRVGVCAM